MISQITQHKSRGILIRKTLFMFKYKQSCDIVSVRCNSNLVRQKQNFTAFSSSKIHRFYVQRFNCGLKIKKTVLYRKSVTKKLIMPCVDGSCRRYGSLLHCVLANTGRPNCGLRALCVTTHWFTETIPIQASIVQSQFASQHAVQIMTRTHFAGSSILSRQYHSETVLSF